MFYEAASSIIGLLSSIHHVTYISVILHNKYKPVQIHTRDFNKSRKPLKHDSVYDDHFLTTLLCRIENLQHGEDMTFSWNQEMAAIELRAATIVEQGLYNGVSMVVRKNNEIVWCITIFSNDEPEEERFHERFRAKKDKIHKILNAYGF